VIRISGGSRVPAVLIKPSEGAALTRRRPHFVGTMPQFATAEEAFAKQLSGLEGRQVGRPVDIATDCGLGRRIPQEATRAVGRMRELLA
jgi:hypothetical protein